MTNSDSKIKEIIQKCYQCSKCSAGCPVSYTMDYLPHQMVRLLQFGMHDAVLSSKTIWLCTSCQTCTARCPRDVDIAGLIDYLKITFYQQQNLKLVERDIYLFNKIFLASIKTFGRVYELGLIAFYNLLSYHLFKDVSIGLTLFRKGKLKILPPKHKSKKELKRIFSQ